jgi:hypothetical protein
MLPVFFVYYCRISLVGLQRYFDPSGDCSFLYTGVFRKFQSNSFNISPVMFWALFILAYGNPAFGGHSRSTLLLIALKPSGRSETRLFSLSESYML